MELVKYDAARYALQQAATVDEVKDIIDKSVAIAAYAKQAKDTKMIEWVTEIKVRAERRAGQMLSEMPKAKGGEHYKTTGQQSLPVVQTLDNIGITKFQSSRWQKLAAVPDEQFEQAVTAAKELAGEVTVAAMLRVEKANRPPVVHIPKAHPVPVKPIQNSDDYSPKDLELDRLTGALEALSNENEHLEFQVIEATKRIDAGDPLKQEEWASMLEEMASLRNEIINLQRNLGAVTSSRDRYMNENAEMKSLIKFQRKELDKAKK